MDRAQGMDYLSAAESGLCREVVVVERGPFVNFFFLFERLRAFYFLLAQVRLWAPPSQISQGTYALDIAANTLSNYEKFFKIPFPLPKQGKHCSCYYKKAIIPRRTELLFYVRGSLGLSHQKTN